MRAYLFYSVNDHTQEDIERLASELETRRVEVVQVDADSRDGSALVELYDVTRRPAVVVARDDGGMVHRWLGMLPNAGDLSYYVNG